MKKLLTILACLVCALVCLVAFSGCNVDPAPPEVLYSSQVESARTDVEYDENGAICLVKGTEYFFDPADYQVRLIYESGNEEVIPLTDSRISYERPPFDGMLSEVGIYFLDVRYESGNISSSSSMSFVVEQVVEKPMITYEINYYGGEHTPTFEVDYDYVEVVGDLSATYAGEYRITFIPGYMVRWSDGTRGVVHLDWEIKPAELNKRYFDRALYYEFDAEYHSFDPTLITDLYSYVGTSSDYIVEQVEYRDSGVYEVDLTLSNNCIFKDGTRIMTYEFEVLQKNIRLPQIITETEYDDRWEDYTAYNDDALENEFFNVTGQFASTAGKHVVVFSLRYPEDSYFYRETGPNSWFSYHESTVSFDWEVKPRQVTRPAIGNTQLVWEGFSQFPEVDMHNQHNYIELHMDGSINEGYYRSNVGKYHVEYRLANPNYVWSDTQTSEDIIMDWEIVKRELCAPGEGAYYYDYLPEVRVQKTFSIEDVVINSPHYVSTFYSEESLPIYDELKPINWVEFETQNTVTKYKYTDLDGIVWIKTVTDNDGDDNDTVVYTQTLDMTAKSIGQQQALYVSCTSAWEGCADKHGIKSYLTIAEKGSQTLTFNLTAEDANLTYGDPLVFDYTVNGEQNGQMKYVIRFEGYNNTTSLNQGDLLLTNRIGEATIDYEYVGSEKYEDKKGLIFFDRFDSCANILARPLSEADVAEVVASEIKLNQTLANSEITGVVNGVKDKVWGSFEWEDDTIIPTKTDSDVTTYRYKFVPLSNCYLPFYGEVSVHLGKGDLVVNEDTMLPSATTGDSYLYEGDLIADIKLGDRNEVENALGEIITGKWEIVAGSSVRIGEPFAFKFTPDDSEWYNGYQTEPSTWLYYKLTGATLKDAPMFIANRENGIEYLGGTIAVTYQNISTERILSFDEVEMVITSPYTLNFVIGGGFAEVEGIFSYDYDATKQEDIEPAFDRNNTVVYINNDMTIDAQWWDSTDGAYFRDHTTFIVKKGVTLDIEKLNQPGMYYGTDRYEEIKQLSINIVNYGTVHINKAYDNIIFYNLGTVKIDYCSTDYLGVYNGKDCLFEIKDVLEIDYTASAVGSVHDNGYNVIGALHNEGTFKFIYYTENEDDDTFYLTKTYKPVFVVVDESYNNGTLYGQFSICAPTTIDTDSVFKTYTLEDLEGNRVGYDVLYTHDGRDFGIDEDQPIKFLVYDVDDFFVAMDYCNARGIRSNIQVYVKRDIDVSNDDRFYPYNISSLNIASLLLTETHSLYVEEGVTLTLGDKTLGLSSGYKYPDDANYIPCASLHNYGTINGNIKYAVYSGWVVQNTMVRYYIFNYGTINGEITSAQ